MYLAILRTYIINFGITSIAILIQKSSKLVNNWEKWLEIRFLIIKLHTDEKE